MRLLLDTHVWLWGLLDPDRLTPRVVRVLRSVKTELWLSSVSVWEALVLIDRGRLEVDGDADAWLDEALAAAPMHEAPLTHAIARQSRAVVVPSRDPADRFLVATAQVLDLTLVTADDRILGGKGYATLACR